MDSSSSQLIEFAPLCVWLGGMRADETEKKVRATLQWAKAAKCQLGFPRSLNGGDLLHERLLL